MIVGKRILEKALIQNGKASRLKNGTFDLTIGGIFPVGREAANARAQSIFPITEYSLAPQEMVWVISEEKFSMPDNVTGIATLRTTLTHKGLLALNVGVIDSHFSGKISTAIINFSDISRTIRVGMPFFRVLFFEHEKVDKQRDDLPSTDADVSDRAANEFPRNFLNLPGSNEQYYGDQLSKLVLGYMKSRPLKSAFFLLFLSLIFVGSFEKILKFLDLIGLLDLEKLIKFVS